MTQKELILKAKKMGIKLHTNTPKKSTYRKASANENNIIAVKYPSRIKDILNCL